MGTGPGRSAKMRGQRRAAQTIVAAAAALMLSLVLMVAPVLVALSHGPGPGVTAVDPVALHAETDRTHPFADSPQAQPADHGPHHSADHDHLTSALLPETATASCPPRAQDATNVRLVRLSHIPQGPRRPPRHV